MIAPISEILIEQICARRGERVLDIGCGGGITSINLANLVAPMGSVLGVDVSEPILEVAKKRATNTNNIEFILNDAETAALEPNNFDIVTSRFGVMFFENPVMAFRNLYISLKPTGRLVFMCWRKLQENPSMNEPVKIVSDLLAQTNNIYDSKKVEPGPFALSDPKYLTQLLEAAEFNNIKLQKLDKNLPMGTLDQAVSYSMKMGPAAKLLQEAPYQIKQQTADQIRQAFQKYTSNNSVNIPSATWIVSATK